MHTKTLLQDLYRWLARARMENAGEEASAAAFGNRIKEALDDLDAKAVSSLSTGQHPDDLAVDRFAAAMKARLAEKRGQGYSGWDDPNELDISDLETGLENTAIGKPVDIGNYAMMLFNRNLEM